MKKVKCVRAPKGCYLTSGKTYQVLHEQTYENWTLYMMHGQQVTDYQVVNDRGIEVYYRANKFESLDCPCHVRNCLKHLGH